MTAPSATPHTSGLTPNVAGALAYVLGPLTGIFFLVVEKENRFVRFHAAQSTIVFLAWIVVGVALSILGGALAVVPVIGWLIGLLLALGIGLASFILWLVLMYRAFRGKEWELPVVGTQARKLAGVPAATP